MSMSNKKLRDFKRPGTYLKNIQIFPVYKKFTKQTPQNEFVKLLYLFKIERFLFSY